MFGSQDRPDMKGTEGKARENVITFIPFACDTGSHLGEIYNSLLKGENIQFKKIPLQTKA